MGIGGVRNETTTVRLLIWTVITLAATLSPFDFKTEGIAHSILELSLSSYMLPLDVVLNILLFVPLGALLAPRLRPRSRHSWGVILAVGASAFAFSFSIEFLQQFLPSRDPSILDVLSNTTGTVLGFHVCAAYGNTIDAQLARLRRNASPTLRVGALAACAIFVLFASGALQYGARVSNWDQEFRLLIGNEHTGDRPWHGRVLRIDLSDASVSEDLVHDFAAGILRPLPPGNIAAFDFATIAASQNAAPDFPPLVWVGIEKASASTGAHVHQGAWLQTARSATQIAHRIRASNEFTVRIVCASDNADQRGPARILSYSIDTMRRNFTLAQEGPDMVFRLRTPNTGANGTRIPAVVPNVFSAREVRDILVTYRGGTLELAIARTNKVHRLEFSPGVSLASFFLNLEPRYFTYISLAYYGFVFLLQFGSLAWLTDKASRFFAISLPWLLTFAVAFEATLAFAAPRPFEWTKLGISLCAGSAVLLLIWAALSPREWRLGCRSHYVTERSGVCTEDSAI